MITNWSQHILEKRITKISSNYLVANQAYAQSSQDQGRNQIVHGVYLRINFTLVNATSATTITINDEDARQNLLTALMSQIQITGSRAGVRGDLVQRMSLGEHYQALRGCGVLPVCPQLFEAGFGAIPQQPRAGGSAQSTLVSLVYPLVPADLGPEFGSIFALGAEQLGGLNFSFQFGSFSWTDSAGAAFTIGAADGAPGATIDAEIIYRYRVLPEGQQVIGNPVRFIRIQNSSADRINLVPAGLTLAHTLRLGTAGTYSAADSAQNLLNNLVYANGVTLEASDIYRVRQYINGEDQVDAVERRLPDVAYEDAFRSPGLEVDEDQYGRTASLTPTTRFFQGGLRLASLRGKRPMSGIIPGAYDIEVPVQFNPSTYTRTHLVAAVLPRDVTVSGASMSSSASGAAYAPVRVRDTVEEVAGIVVGL
jgi:hypothetical protein